METKLIKTEQFKELFTKLVELGEYYCDMFGVENDKLIKAKHNILKLENAILFKGIYEEIFTEDFVLNMVKCVNTFADKKILEVENEINKNRPTERA